MKKSGSVYLAFVLFLVGTLLVSACASIVPPNTSRSNPTSTNAGIPNTGTQPAGPAPSLQVIANDQNYDGTNVVVAKVISQGPGWMAIHSQSDGHIGPVIGYTHLNDGENDNINVKIDPKQATPVLYAMLHVDANKVGTYEFPGPDVPAMLNGAMVSPAFKATIGQSTTGPVPFVSIRDQNVASGKVFVDQAFSVGPGWIAIHVQNPDGTPGQEIGYSALKDGVNKGIFITIDASKATPVLVAMLHIDAGDVGTYEFPGPDSPVMVNGQMVSPTFKSTTGVGLANATPQASLAPNITGTPAAQAAPATQANTPVPPTPAASAAGNVTATPQNNSVQPVVKISDQTIQNGMVMVDDVVSNGPGWIVIYTMNNGQPDQPIGHAAVKDGDNPKVMAPVDPSKATDTLYAQLQMDAGKVGTFEFPGPDAPVVVGVRLISGTFKNIAASAAAPQATQQSTTQAPTTPSISVQDQPIHNGMLLISQVVAVGDTWLVIHPRNPDGSMGEYIGYALVHDGVTKNVLVKIDLSKATRGMYGMLHVDASKAARPQFPGIDAPVLVNGQMVLPAFNVIGSLSGDVSLSVGKDSQNAPILADGWGNSLYLNLNDKPGTSNCNGDCLKNFQPLLATGAISAANGVSISKVSVILRSDGTRQVAYAGSPLYYFNGDAAPGDTKGQGQNGQWFLLTP